VRFGVYRIRSRALPNPNEAVSPQLGIVSKFIIMSAFDEKPGAGSDEIQYGSGSEAGVDQERDWTVEEEKQAKRK
jgi:hypothetical protein